MQYVRASVALCTANAPNLRFLRSISPEQEIAKARKDEIAKKSEPMRNGGIQARTKRVKRTFHSAFLILPFAFAPRAFGCGRRLRCEICG
jgi:hypothetical protein